MLEVTQSAVQAIQRVIAETGEDVFGLRVVVMVGGCAGFRYRMGLESSAQEGDDIIEFEGVKVLIDADSRPWLEGATIDFRDDLAEAGFVFDNPNALGKCSCDKSFCDESETTPC